MTTLARAWRRQAEQPVEMVVWEPSLEGLARHMLLLSIMLDTELTARGACAPWTGCPIS
jgi:dynein assembly factor 3